MLITIVADTKKELDYKFDALKKRIEGQSMKIRRADFMMEECFDSCLLPLAKINKELAKKSHRNQCVTKALRAAKKHGYCDKNKLAKEFAAMYSDNEEQAAAVKEVDRAFARMETVTPKAVNPDEQSIIVVCKGFGDEGDDTVCIEVGDLRNWKEKHTKKSEPISDEMLTFMSTDEIENAVMNQDLPTKYAFELSAWDEILSWKLAPSSIYIYGLEFCLSRVLWEMTFFGVDESGVELEKEKLDTRFEEAQRFFDENKEPQIGFSIEDIAKKLLGDDYTEDWYPEEEQERDRRNMVISSYIASTTAALFWWVDG